MMRIILCAVMVLTINIANAQSKKEQIENLTISLDSLNQVVSDERQIFKQEAQSKDAEISSQKNQINIVAKRRPPAMILKNHIAEGIDPKRKVLYRNFHSIDGKIYLIEISRNALKVFMLLFPNFEAPDIFLSEIMAEKKA